MLHGIKKYERDHLNAIVASFAPKFSHLLPPEMVRRVVEYAFHVGDYLITNNKTSETLCCSPTPPHY